MLLVPRVFICFLIYVLIPFITSKLCDNEKYLDWITERGITTVKRIESCKDLLNPDFCIRHPQEVRQYCSKQLKRFAKRFEPSYNNANSISFAQCYYAEVFFSNNKEFPDGILTDASKVTDSNPLSQLKGVSFATIKSASKFLTFFLPNMDITILLDELPAYAKLFKDMYYDERSKLNFGDLLYFMLPTLCAATPDADSEGYDISCQDFFGQLMGQVDYIVQQLHYLKEKGLTNFQDAAKTLIETIEVLSERIPFDGMRNDKNILLNALAEINTKKVFIGFQNVYLKQLECPTIIPLANEISCYEKAWLSGKNLDTINDIGQAKKKIAASYSKGTTCAGFMNQFGCVTSVYREKIINACGATWNQICKKAVFESTILAPADLISKVMYLNTIKALETRGSQCLNNLPSELEIEAAKKEDEEYAKLLEQQANQPVELEKPNESQTNKPVELEKPIESQTNKPVELEKPIESQTNQPVKLEKPNESQATQPVEPEKSNESQATQPVEPEKPIESPTNQPVKPENPNESQATQPVEPEKPNESPTNQPVKPENPNESPTNQPVKPEKPNESQTNQPAKPEKPNESQTNQPVKPEKPNESQTNKPVEVIGEASILQIPFNFEFQLTSSLFSEAGLEPLPINSLYTGIPQAYMDKVREIINSQFQSILKTPGQNRFLRH